MPVEVARERMGGLQLPIRSLLIVSILVRKLLSNGQICCLLSPFVSSGDGLRRGLVSQLTLLFWNFEFFLFTSLLLPIALANLLDAQTLLIFNLPELPRGRCLNFSGTGP